MSGVGELVFCFESAGFRSHEHPTGPAAGGIHPADIPADDGRRYLNQVS
jgi:hypothetical protein